MLIDTSFTEVFGNVGNYILKESSQKDCGDTVTRKKNTSPNDPIKISMVS
jgi:hypothetical protein